MTMRKEDPKIISDELERRAVLVCASDFGWRLSIDWLDRRAHWRIVWSAQDGWGRLRLDAPRMAKTDFDP